MSGHWMLDVRIMERYDRNHLIICLLISIRKYEQLFVMVTFMLTYLVSHVQYKVVRNRQYVPQLCKNTLPLVAILVTPNYWVNFAINLTSSMVVLTRSGRILIICYYTHYNNSKQHGSYLPLSQYLLHTPWNDQLHYSSESQLSVQPISATGIDRSEYYLGPLIEIL